jgi:hypothetical protein
MEVMFGSVYGVGVFVRVKLCRIQCDPNGGLFPYLKRVNE